MPPTTRVSKRAMGQLPKKATRQYASAGGLSGEARPSTAAAAAVEEGVAQQGHSGPAEAAAEAQQPRIIEHGDRKVEASEGGVKMALDTDSLLAEFENLASYAGGTGGDGGSGGRSGGNGSWAVGQRPDIETEKLRKEMDPLELRAIVKIIPERIYSMVIHPDTQRDLMFAGDKVGNVALWDCTDAGKLVGSVQSSSVRNGAAGNVGDDGEDEWEDEGEEERVWGKWWHWNAHSGRKSISWLKFRPNQPSSIYHSSYDRTLRVTHFETGMSEEVIDGDHWSEEALLHSFDFDPTGNELSDDKGGLIWRDLRQPKESAKRWDIDRYKVGCISINQANPNLAATAHVKRDMCLWDLSTLRGLPETAEPAEVQDKARILAYEHEYACSSAYFDPTGTRLATTSYDDSIRVWNVEPSKPRAIARKEFEPLRRIAHNCQVGRYVTVLRAHWSTVPSLPPHLHVGDMRRTIDLISPDGVTVKWFHNLDAITAVPAVTAAHPTVAGKYYGGAASGKDVLELAIIAGSPTGAAATPTQQPLAVRTNTAGSTASRGSAGSGAGAGTQKGPQEMPGSAAGRVVQVVSSGSLVHTQSLRESAVTRLCPSHLTPALPPALAPPLTSLNPTSDAPSNPQRQSTSTTALGPKSSTGEVVVSSHFAAGPTLPPASDSSSSLVIPAKRPSPSSRKGKERASPPGAAGAEEGEFDELDEDIENVDPVKALQLPPSGQAALP
ncbi:WD40-repeat-containing domain protein [Rhodotorula toruloides]